MIDTVYAVLLETVCVCVCARVRAFVSACVCVCYTSRVLDTCEPATNFKPKMVVLWRTQTR